MSLTDCPLLIILSVPYLESIVEIFSSDTPSSLPFWCWPGDRTDQTEIPPIDFFLINLRYQQQRKDGRSEGMELTASEGLTWLEAGWWNTRRVRSGVSGVTETRQFLPAGGATAGQWPINRPNIAGLGLQQNEDSILNHLNNEGEQNWVYREMRIPSGII